MAVVGRPAPIIDVPHNTPPAAIHPPIHLSTRPGNLPDYATFSSSCLDTRHGSSTLPSWGRDSPAGTARQQLQDQSKWHQEDHHGVRRLPQSQGPMQWRNSKMSELHQPVASLHLPAGSQGSLEEVCLTPPLTLSFQPLICFLSASKHVAELVSLVKDLSVHVDDEGRQKIAEMLGQVSIQACRVR